MDKIQLQKHLDELFQWLKKIEFDVIYYDILELIVSTHINFVTFRNSLNEYSFEKNGKEGIEVNKIAILLHRASIQQDAILDDTTGEVITKAVLTDNGIYMNQVVQDNKEDISQCSESSKEPDYSSEAYRKHYEMSEKAGCTMFMHEPQ